MLYPLNNTKSPTKTRRGTLNEKPQPWTVGPPVINAIAWSNRSVPKCRTPIFERPVKVESWEKWFNYQIVGKSFFQ